jgi:hypothetical protein
VSSQGSRVRAWVIRDRIPSCYSLSRSGALAHPDDPAPPPLPTRFILRCSKIGINVEFSGACLPIYLYATRVRIYQTTCSRFSMKRKLLDSCAKQSCREGTLAREQSLHSCELSIYLTHFLLHNASTSAQASNQLPLPYHLQAWETTARLSKQHQHSGAARHNPCNRCLCSGQQHAHSRCQQAQQPFACDSEPSGKTHKRPCSKKSSQCCCSFADCTSQASPGLPGRGLPPCTYDRGIASVEHGRLQNTAWGCTQ